MINFSSASFVAYIGMYFLAFFGFYQDGFLLGIFLFIIGWFISSFINDKLFTKQRDILTISDEEKSLILNLQTIQNKHFTIRDKINQNGVMINFCNYDELKKDFDTIYDELKSFNTKSLSFKYKQNHQKLIEEYKKQIDIFHTIYANK